RHGGYRSGKPLRHPKTKARAVNRSTPSRQNGRAGGPGAAPPKNKSKSGKPLHPITPKPGVLGARRSTPSRQNRTCWGPRRCATRRLGQNRLRRATEFFSNLFSCGGWTQCSSATSEVTDV